MSNSVNKIDSALFSILMVAIIMVITLQTVIWVVDNKSYPGCKIVGFEQSAETIIIELDEDLATGTDHSCQLAGQLIYEICLDGYSVRVTNWTIKETIHLERARVLAEGY